MLNHKAILHVVCLVVVYLYCVRATPNYSNEDNCLLPGKLSTSHNKTIMFICGNISSLCDHSKKDKTAETTCCYIIIILR